MIAHNTATLIMSAGCHSGLENLFRSLRVLKRGASRRNVENVLSFESVTLKTVIKYTRTTRYPIRVLCSPCMSSCNELSLHSKFLWFFPFTLQRFLCLVFDYPTNRHQLQLHLTLVEISSNKLLSAHVRMDYHTSQPL